MLWSRAQLGLGCALGKLIIAGLKNLLKEHISQRKSLDHHLISNLALQIHNPVINDNYRSSKNLTSTKPAGRFRRIILTMFEIDWIGLSVPFAYVAVLVGSLITFSSVYRKRKAGL